MAKKKEVVKKSNTTKRAAASGEKPVIKPRKTKPAATRKPTTAPKPPTRSRIQTTASNQPQKEDKNFVVFGTVVYADGKPAAGLTVIAYDNDDSGKDILGQPQITKELGAFLIPYREADFRKTIKERGGADVIVCVYNDKRELLFTSKKKNNAPEKYGLKITVPTEQYVVRGTVTDANRKPLANMFVRAYERDLRITQLLGAVETHESGEFNIAYSLANFQLADVPARRTPWLIVEVLASSDGEVLATQEVQKATRDQTVSFTLASVGTVSEWRRISDAAHPLLRGQGAESIEVRSNVVADKNRLDLLPFDLTPADVKFIARDANLDRVAVEAWVASSRILRDALLQLDEEHAAEKEVLNANGAAFFFSQTRVRGGGTLDEILRLGPQQWGRSQRDAEAAGRVPPLSDVDWKQLEAVLTLLVGRRQLNPASAGKPALLGDYLALAAGDSVEWRTRFARKGINILGHLEKTDLMAPTALEQLTGVVGDEALAGRLFNALRLGRLTDDHLPLITALQAKISNPVPGAVGPEAALVTLRRSSWIDLAFEHGVPPRSALRPETYGEQLHARVEGAAPVAMLVHVLETEPFSGSAESPESPVCKSLGEALRKRFDVDLMGKSASELAKELALSGAEAKLLGSLKQLKQVDVRWAEAVPLLERHIDSPPAIVYLGAKGFAEQLDGVLPDSRLRSIWAKAASLAVVHIGARGMLHPYLLGAPSPVITTRSSKVVKDAVHANPTLGSLFGGLDQCGCDPCLSVLSPAAYLADLLTYVGQGAARRVLEERRPDPYYLKLSCENSNSEVVHIDLVNEILENAIALPMHVDLQSGSGVTLPNSDAPSAPVRDALGATVTGTLGVLTAVKQPPRPGDPYGVTYWTISDSYRQWAVTAESEYVGFAPMTQPDLNLAAQERNRLLRALEDNELDALEVDDPTVQRVLRNGLGAPNLPLYITRAEVAKTKVADGVSTWVIEATATGRVTVVLGSGAYGAITLTPTGARTQPTSFQRPRTEVQAIGRSLSASYFPQQLLEWCNEHSKVRINLTPDGPNAWFYTVTKRITLISRQAGIWIRGLCYQSSDAELDLLTAPQNRNPLAYQRLDRPDAVYPWTLPYDSKLQETRGLLDVGQLPRIGWLSASRAFDARLDDPAIIRELLGLSEREFELIAVSATVTSTPALHACWGYAQAAQIVGLRHAEQLLKRSGLTLAELSDLLESRVVNPGGMVVIHFPQDCQLDSAELTGVDTDDALNGFVDRLHRYVRLWRRIALPVQTLDLALLRAAPAQPLSERSLNGLAHLKAVAATTDMSLREVLEWFYAGPMALARALGMNGDEFESAAFVLARAEEPFAVSDPIGSPQLLHRFVGEVGYARLRDQLWTELAYALHHAGPQVELLEWPQSHRAQWLDSLHADLAAPLLAPRSSQTEPSEAQEARWRRWGLTQPVAPATDWNVPSPDDATQILSDQPLALLQRLNVLTAQFGLTPEVLQQMLRAQNLSINAQQKIPSLTIEQLDQLELWREWFRSIQPSKAIATSLAQALSADVLVVQELCELPLETNAGNSSAAMIWLLDLLLRPLPSAGAQARLVYDGCLVRLHKLVVLNRSWKVGAAQLRWLRPATTKPRFTGLNPAEHLSLTLTGGSASALPAYGAWKRTSALMALAGIGTGMATILEAYRIAVDTGSSPTVDPRWALLASAFRFKGAGNASDATAVQLIAESLGDTPFERRLDPLWISDLCGALALVQRTGLASSQFVVLSAAAPTDDSISAATDLLARMGEQARTDALRRVQNRLREERRDRLVDYLLWRDDQPDANALYARYLIDTQMSACMTTTRMLQASAAVQLFVQRCLLNLEAEVQPSLFDSKRWQWMSAYRVWEANRKVFLYPENWLYPELRDDKTETFQAFENQVNTNEPESARAEAALITYTESLVDLGQVDVVATYEGSIAARKRWGSSTLRKPNIFQIGRSTSDPKRCYFREARLSLESGDGGSWWGGWKVLNLDVSEDHVLLFGFQEQLYIAWPLATIVDDTKTGLSNYRIQLAYSRQTDESWTTRATVQCSESIPVLAGRTARTNLHFTVSQSWDSSAVNVWHAIGSQTQVTLPAAGIELTSQNRYVSSRDSLIDPVYWTLSFSSTAFVRFQDSGRVVQASCRCWMRHVMADTDQGHEGILIRSYEDEYGPINATTQQSFQLSSPVIIEFTAEIDVPGVVPPVTVPAAQTLSYDFSDSNAGLGGEPNLGDEYSATLTFTVTHPEDPEKASEEDALQMSLAGSFRFMPAGAVWNKASSGRNLTPRQGFQFWCSQEKQINPAAIAYLESTGTPLVDRPGLGHLIISTAAPENLSTTKLRYLAESGNRYLVSGLYCPPFLPPPPAQSSPLRRAILAAGIPDAVLYRRQGIQGLDSLYARELQDQPVNSELGVETTDNYFQTHAPLDVRDMSDPQFNLTQPYAIYNWEVFLHAPLAAAVSLSRQHRFEDARRWFHFIFDPTSNTSGDSRSRFWRFLPFRHAEAPPTITDWLQWAANPNAQGDLSDRAHAQISAWAGDPFNPFAVARLRPAAYEWFTVIAYVRNLLDWADQLYRRETREAIAEASLLYVLASEILGPRPQQIDSHHDGITGGKSNAVMSYRELEQLGAGRIADETFGNAWVGALDNPLMQAWLNFMEWIAQHGVAGAASFDDLQDLWAKLASTGSLYFCVPPNEKLLELWDEVENRLFNIRHCRNIDGMPQPLPLYEPPIDPELLIRARAAGGDLAEVLDERFAPLGPYRFQVLLQKANEFCNEVKSLGAALLITTEKRDGEHLVLLRSEQEIGMLREVERIKIEQIKEAQANIESLDKTRENAMARFTYVQRQLGNEKIVLDSRDVPVVEQSLMLSVKAQSSPVDVSGLGLSNQEIQQLNWMNVANNFTIAAGISRMAAGVMHVASAAVVWTPPPAPPDLGYRLLQAGANAASALGDGLGTLAANAGTWERRAGLVGGWQRRRDEWVQQSKMTAEEIRQIDKQRLALEIRKRIAEKELENHRKQIDYTNNVDEYIRHLKFSSEVLYDWMQGQLSTVYFGAYQMAVALAKRAERSLQHELGDDSLSFIQFGHWDSLRKGLGAGEQLSQDLRRMESAQLSRNIREFEITKHVSLRQLDPAALLMLRGEGQCNFNLPEWLFDLDFPGHYFRRIKSISVSLPCIVGPYTSISGTLTMLRSEIRHKPARVSGNTDPNRATSHLSIQSIATSSAQSDSGLFELNFRDERYLPFEGAGAESSWLFTLPKDFSAFDHQTISDLVLHVRYTAREGGDSLRTAAIDGVKKQARSTDGFTQLLRLKQDFSSEMAARNVGQSLNITISDDMRPYVCRTGFVLLSAEVWLKGAQGGVPVTPPSDGKTLVIPAAMASDQDPYILLRYQLYP